MVHSAVLNRNIEVFRRLQNISAEELKQVLKDVPVSLRQVSLLYFEKGKNPNEIAMQLGLKKGMVYRGINRGYNVLHKHFRTTLYERLTNYGAGF